MNPFYVRMTRKINWKLSSLSSVYCSMGTPRDFKINWIIIDDEFNEVRDMSFNYNARLQRVSLHENGKSFRWALNITTEIKSSRKWNSLFNVCFPSASVKGGIVISGENINSVFHFHSLVLRDDNGVTAKEGTLWIIRYFIISKKKNKASCTRLLFCVRLDSSTFQFPWLHFHVIFNSVLLLLLIVMPPSIHVKYEHELIV